MKILVINKIRHDIMRFDELEPFTDELYFIGTPKYAKGVSSTWRARCAAFTVVAELDLEIVELFISTIGTVDRIVCFSEEDLYLAAALRERHGVNGALVEQILPFRDKLAMKEILKEAGLRVPKFAEMQQFGELPSALFSAASSEFGIPFVIKPRVGMANQGVFVLKSPEELAEVVRKYDIQSRLYMVEEFVSGEMFHVDTFFWNEFRHVSISAYTVPQLAARTGPTGSITLDSNSPDYDKLLQINSAILRALSLPNGCAHAEFFKGEDGEFVFCEVGARIGGTQVIPVIERVSGLNFAQMWFEAETGLKFRKYPRKVYKSGGFLDFPIKPHSFVQEIETEPDVSGIELLEQRVSVGDYTGEPILEQNRALSYFVGGDSYEEVKLNMSKLLNSSPISWGR